jgi:RimJ/RimL family protein N-acetyltransferase
LPWGDGDADHGLADHGLAAVRVLAASTRKERDPVLDGRSSPHDDEIRLEPLGAEHLEGLAAIGRDPEVQRFTYVPSPWVEGFERRWVEGYESAREDGTRAGFAIVDRRHGRFLGLAALVTIDRDAKEAEAGYIVSPEARGHGVGVRALRLLSDWALDELELERLELRITAENAASIRVAERCGFLREGVLRSVHFKQGLRADVAVYSRLRSDTT